MITYFFKSSYRFPILGLVLATLSLWYFWLKSDQIISANLPTFTTGAVLLNIVLSFFSSDRNQFVTRFLLVVAYIIVLLALYTLYSLTRGLR